MTDVFGGPNSFGEGRVLDAMKTLLHRLVFGHSLRDVFPIQTKYEVL
jgi:hypothetical protein